MVDNLASHYPQADGEFFNIGLLHTALTGRDGHENYAPCALDELKAKGYDYWALGHIHKLVVVCEAPLVVFPGNIQGRHIKEIGAKSVTMVTIDNGRIPEITEHELDVLRWAICQVDLSGCETVDAAYSLVRQGFEQEQVRADGMTFWRCGLF